MAIEIVTVDAFTERRFAGNPAAVCVLPEPAEELWMQAVAAEMNLSETAFLHPRGEEWDLRWFTPTVEVDLCGHATLASAHVLWEDGRIGADQPVRFLTRGGLLKAERRGEWIELDLPALPAEPIDPPAELLAALGVTAVRAGQSRFDYLVELESEEQVRAVAPDFRRLAALTVRGAIVTSRAASSDFDFVSRFFAPACGIDEDPVCGSAHCCLGPYWKERLRKDELLGHQVSARGGVLRVRPVKDRVMLGGQAVTVLRAELV